MNIFNLILLCYLSLQFSDGKKKKVFIYLYSFFFSKYLKLGCEEIFFYGAKYKAKPWTGGYFKIGVHNNVFLYKSQKGTMYLYRYKFFLGIFFS